MAQTIALTQDRIARVDDEDWESLSQFKWQASLGSSCIYAVRTDCSARSRRTLLMHRVILSPPPDMEIDHINGDGLDNRRSNLRACTRSQNHMNMRKRRGCSSTYKGVSWYKRGRNWQAHIKYQGIQYYLGRFDDEREAARAYNVAAQQHFGEFAQLNEI